MSQLDTFLEIGEDYNLSQSNAQVFKTLNLIANINLIDEIKIYKGKSKLCIYCRFNYNFKCPVKRDKL